MRLGIFGGSFDPIHLGHLILAEQCREQARLDQVWFIPSATAPHKPAGATATDRHRLEMVQLAIAGHDAFAAKDTELARGGKSYTVDTLAAIHEQNPDWELFLMLGGDSLSQLGTWREPQKICQMALPLVYYRPESPYSLDALRPLVNQKRFEEICRVAIVSRLIDISSVDIRERVRSNRTIRYLVPRAIEKYIDQHQLYRV